MEPELVKAEESEEQPPKPPAQYFQCETCGLREKYEFFGKTTPLTRNYQFEEDCYVIEDPFLPPKRGEILILGAHCIKCGKSVCRDANCSFYYAGTHCIECAKDQAHSFPDVVQRKLNKIIL